MSDKGLTGAPRRRIWVEDGRPSGSEHFERSRQQTWEIVKLSGKNGMTAAHHCAALGLK
jgi:hypothetical protein